MTGAPGSGKPVSGRLYVGTSGFAYTEWRGVFYPERLAASRMLDHYAARLGAVEINGSFYRSPPEAALAGWAAGTPAGFRFCFKAHRGITYSAAAFDKSGLAADFARRISSVGEKAGPVLVQFPPTARPDAGLLDGVLEALRLPAAVEFRSEAWFDRESFSVLERHGAGLVVTDQEKWPRAPELDGPVGYYRLRRDYDRPALEDWIRLLARRLPVHEATYVFFKHEPEAPQRAAAVLHALEPSGSQSSSPGDSSSVDSE